MGSGRTIIAICVGAFAVLAGIVTSTLLDLPAGPALVFAFAIIAILVRVTSQGMALRQRP